MSKSTPLTVFCFGLITRLLRPQSPARGRPYNLDIASFLGVRPDDIACRHDYAWMWDTMTPPRRTAICARLLCVLLGWPLAVSLVCAALGMIFWQVSSPDLTWLLLTSGLALVICWCIPGTRDLWPRIRLDLRTVKSANPEKWQFYLDQLQSAADQNTLQHATPQVTPRCTAPSRL